MLSLHLYYKHDMNCDEYKDLFPGAETMSASHVAKATASLVRYNKSEEHREQVSEMNRERWEDPEWRKAAIKRSSDNLKRLWQDPEFRDEHALRNAFRAMGGSYGTPTELRGVLYKSKVEADFAELCRELRLDAFYEPFAIRLDEDRRYVPDFYIEDCDFLVEVKYDSNEIDHEKMDDVRLVGWDIEVVTRRTFDQFRERWNVWDA